MKRISILALAALAFTPAMPLAASAGNIHQSPLMMRRAGPSCRPGHLGGARYAGYRYLRGPCRGVDHG